jgi:hypothetical protein
MSFLHTDPIWLFSNPIEASKRACRLYNLKLYRSSRKNKKYYIITPDGHKVHFGAMGYEDYTKHNDDYRRDSYLKRSLHILGNWESNKYSPNNLSIHILWNVD